MVSEQEQILVPEEICAYLRITKAKFYYLAGRGRLSFLFKVGNEWRARRHDLEEWIQSNTAVMLAMRERSVSVSREAEVVDRITTDQIRSILTEEGFEVQNPSEGVLTVTEVDSGIVMHAVLQENVLFCTVSCLVVSEDAVTPELMRTMLSAENGISTSAFQLYKRADGQTAITLNNFCKLQTMEEEDRDDILSCLEFLVVDVCAARDLLGALAQ